jgi:hypothetical protein
MKLKFFFLLMATGCCYLARAQSTTQQVLATGGAYYSAGGYSLSLTIGEMAAVQTYSNATAVLTQGFQQSDITGVGIAPLNETVAGFSSFPNPANDLLHLSFNATERGELRIVLYDVQGNEVMLPVTAAMETGNNLQTLELPVVASGLYEVMVTFLPENGSPSHFTQTISIVH